MTLMDESDFNDIMRSLDDELSSLRMRLSRIAEAHSKYVDAHGGTYGICNECDWSWPCPTYTWATTDRKLNDTWNPKDDASH